MMKKIFIVFLIVSVMATFFAIPASAESTGGVTGRDAYDIMVKFVTQYPARKSGSDGAEEAADYIKGCFDGIVAENGGDIEVVSESEPQKVYETEVQEFTYELYTQGMGFMSYPTIKEIKDRNVIATKKSDVKNAKTVIIGAHYDNAQDQNQGEGAYDNGSGVGVMLSLAERLKDEKLDFNLVFVAFGAHEYYFEGSAQFVQRMSLSEKLDVALYINLDSIAGGDNLYIYADEFKTVQEDYFVGVAKEQNIDLRTPPVNKGTYLSAYTKLGYSHVGLDSDNLPFFNADIPSVSFSSHNWTIASSGVLDESADSKKPNVIGTKDDTVDKLNKLYGETVKTRMNDVEDLIFSAITDETFIGKIKTARSENTDYSLLTNPYFIPLITLGFMIIVTVAVVLLNKKYKGKKPNSSNNKFKDGEKEGEGPRMFEDFD